jgi:pimeloyl-ACP methyl ester carboxylesterase
MGAFHDLGLPALALAYRNHDASTASPDGLYHYGASEWEDALVGARELRARGYDRVVLYGVSMGGAVALEALKRWPADAPSVVGIVLDSPLVDPYPVIEFGAEKAGMPLPGLLTRLGLLVAGLRTGVDYGSLRQYLSAANIAVPVLLIAGEADTTVPITAIDRFSQAVAAPLTYVRLPGVEHVEAWNHDPAAYAEWLRLFLASLNVSA